MDATALEHKTGHRQTRRRVGRGNASGSGTRCGRGNKGQRSRSGFSRRLGFEGGQMPLFRRLPKRGFNNTAFGITWTVINVQALNQFAAGSTVETKDIQAVGLAKNLGDGLKILGEGELGHALTVHAHRFSAGARAKIEAAGGTCVQLPHRARTPEQREEKRARRVKKGRPVKQKRKRR